MSHPEFVKSHSFLTPQVTLPKSLLFFQAGAMCAGGRGCTDVLGKRKARGIAYSPGKAHLQGDNLMDVMDSAFSIHNLYGILSSKVQMHNECLS